MDRARSFLAALIVSVLPVGTALAQAAATDHQAHHPAPDTAAPAAPGPAAAPGMGGMMGMMGGMSGAPGGGMQMGGMPCMAGMMMGASHVEGRIAFLKAELKITDAQLPQWNAVADAIRGNAQAMQKAHEGMMPARGERSLPDRLAQHEKMITGHLEALGKFKAAVGPLYQSMSEEQKKLADALLGSPMAAM